MADDWRRLANYVRARRTQLGWYTAQQLADDTGLTRQTISTLENGRRVRASTLARLENALDWRPGSAQAILNGGEPTTAEPGDATAPHDQPPIQLRDEVERQIWALPTDEVHRRSLIIAYRTSVGMEQHIG